MIDVTMIENYFGVCPKCCQTDGYLNIGESHWFFCREHKLKWCVGWNLFSSWQHETEEEQRRKYDAEGFGDYEQIEGFHSEQPISARGGSAPQGEEQR
jgi:hypothetical protein